MFYGKYSRRLFIYAVHEELALLRVTYFHKTPSNWPKMISILSKLYRDSRTRDFL